MFSGRESTSLSRIAAPVRPAILVMAFALTPALVFSQGSKPDGITAVRENGRVIYVNDESPAQKAAAQQARTARVTRYIYWSNTEHRWKPVAPASPNALKAARSAAVEVAEYIAAQPKVEPEMQNSAPVKIAKTQQADPNYRQITSTYAVASEDVDKAIEDAAARHNVDPNLVRAIIKVESNYNPRAVSRKGAMGLMQLMPKTARGLNVSNPFDPQQNVDAGVRHLKGLLQNFNGDVGLSLAAYNAGQGAVARNNGIPPYAETQNYVKRITSLYGPGRSLVSNAPGKSPIRVFRDSRGVLTISND